MHQAKSTFEVSAWLPDEWKLDVSSVAEVTSARIDKSFAGDLDGTSVAKLIGTQPMEGSASYVAMERFSGSLAGRTGTFAYAHSSTLFDNTVTNSMLIIVPASGTGVLGGIHGSGQMRVDEDGSHHITLDYDFA